MGSGSKSTTKTSSSTQPTVPANITSAYNGYLGQVNNLAQTPATAYTTPATANQTQAFARANAGTGTPTAPAQAATANMMGYTPPSVTAGQLSDTTLSPYMNPFQGSVIDSTLGEFGQGNALGLNQLRASTPSGAFNGSRQGVAEGQLTSDNMRTLASTLSGLNSQNFTQAQGAAQSDIATKLQAALANQGADISGAGLRLNAADQAGNLALAGAANTRADTQLQSDQGAIERGINQDNNPNVAQTQLLQLLQSLYGINPAMFAGQTSKGTQTQTQSSGLLDSLSALASGAGALGWNPFSSAKKLAG